MEQLVTLMRINLRDRLAEGMLSDHLGVSLNRKIQANLSLLQQPAIRRLKRLPFQEKEAAARARAEAWVNLRAKTN